MAETAVLEAAPAGPRSGSPAAVELDGLARGYGDRPALEGVSLRLARGESLAVLGSNGAGKSTLLRVLATLLRPHAGSVRVLGHPLPAEAERVRGRIGFMGHDPGLYGELSARESLLFHARLHGVEADRVDELLAAVGLSRRAGDRVRELSRGMAQRLSAARSVLHHPELLLLDEPRASLDPAAAELLEPLIGRPSGRTRVLVTHDVEGGLAECDAVLGLRRGRTVLLARAGGLEPSAVRRELYR